ncbi:hypothetical protein KNP414_03300 [Paenibacillus mucilaginosus KNP414]|uniref:Uncharacterized protein n=1 Tax=Paenibacillus mucilaginosus (strain KNP414) TaxID=1036673 RepID=F8FFE0_PAEMK|nr:hypothetical protein KNP414_03300 [Paenibacillus mucilaginosus KNP414]
MCYAAPFCIERTDKCNLPIVKSVQYEVNIYNNRRYSQRGIVQCIFLSG